MLVLALGPGKGSTSTLSIPKIGQAYQISKSSSVIDTFRTDVDNRMSFVEIFKLLPDRHVKFVMNGRHINFKYANCLLSGLLVSERESQLGDRYQGIFDNGFSSILQDMSKKQIDNPIRKILMGTRSVSVEPWVEKLLVRIFLPERDGMNSS